MEGDETNDDDEVEAGDADGGMVALSMKLFAAAAATLWIDLGDMTASPGIYCEELKGKLKLAEEPLRHRSAAS